jgi:transcriptional regulator with XRE-family HTH domain
MFIERIKPLREKKELPLRKLAAALDIDSATYCKIERGNVYSTHKCNGFIHRSQGISRANTKSVEPLKKKQ